MSVNAGRGSDDLGGTPIDRAVAEIYQRFGERLTVAELARSARYSRFHFAREFRRATGVPPGRFLTAVRIQEAKRLLLATPLSIREIAHRVGYASPGSFSTAFKSNVGYSPAAYRAVASRTLS